MWNDSGDDHSNCSELNGVPKKFMSTQNLRMWLYVETVFADEISWGSWDEIILDFGQLMSL